jgi:2-oxo-4-hydroxy-4-carboxy-5-ureidoimidazoline decarboxylase
MTLDQLNSLDAEAFRGAVGNIFEHGPWVAAAAAGGRPYPTVAALHDAMMAALRAAPRDRQVAFLRGHPELGSKVARKGKLEGDLTDASRAEQGSLGLDRLSDEEFSLFNKLNALYQKKFAFPFVICVRRNTRDAILDGYMRRIENDLDAEIAVALDEVGHITRLRLAARLDGPGKPRTDGRLSTHVLDTMRGRPAAGVEVNLYETGAHGRGLLVTAVTNADGRTDAPLIAGEPLRIGRYQLIFHVGQYFAQSFASAVHPPFLDLVPVNFAIAEPEADYHVPLLVSPWSYTTYRGS